MYEYRDKTNYSRLVSVCRPLEVTEEAITSSGVEGTMLGDYYMTCLFIDGWISGEYSAVRLYVAQNVYANTNVGFVIMGSEFSILLHWFDICVCGYQVTGAMNGGCE